mmetsp:Transcript_115736/g.323682  ORF Transcript_115736/g.323682 Transcript_115736/m.323682 type:complete len:208 (+) Transcript_115736:299-922(+)
MRRPSQRQRTSTPGSRDSSTYSLDSSFVVCWPSPRFAGSSMSSNVFDATSSGSQSASATLCDCSGPSVYSSTPSEGERWFHHMSSSSQVPHPTDLVLGSRRNRDSSSSGSVDFCAGCLSTPSSSRTGIKHDFSLSESHVSSNDGKPTHSEDATALATNEYKAACSRRRCFRITTSTRLIIARTSHNNWSPQSSCVSGGVNNSSGGEE